MTLVPSEASVAGAAQSRGDRRLVWAAVVALLLLAGLTFWNLPDRHFMTPFREGQTALLTAELAKGGAGGSGGLSWLAAPTPVFGYPWEVPMEFPLYQRVVAGLGASGWPLDFLGRAVNALFTVAAFLLAGAVARRAGLNLRRRLLLVLLALCSPLYFGYGTAFLIEGCALFFAVAWIWSTVRAFESDAVWPWLLAAGCSLAAGLVKPTTWAPAAAGVALYLALDIRDRRRSGGPAGPWWKLAGVALIMLGTVVLVQRWVDYSDRVKLLNPLAAGLTSANLQAWNFGTWAQKLSPGVWLAIGIKTLVLVFGVGGLALPLLAIPAWRARGRAGDPRAAIRRRALLASLGAAAAAPLVFTNLHLQHDYYQFANGLYLWAVLALGLAALDAAGLGRWTDRALWVLLFSCSLTAAGYVLFRKSLRDPADEAVIAALARLPPGRPVAYVGFDYSGKLPYYSRRPALMTITMLDVTSGRLDAALRLNRGAGYGAVVIGGPAYLEAGWKAARELGLERPVLREVFPRTGMIVPAADAGRLAANGDAGATDPVIATVLAEAAGKPSGYYRVAVERTARGMPCGVKILFKRRDQLFYFRSWGLTLTRLKAVD